MADHLEYIVSLRGGAEAAKEARALASAVDGVGGKMRAVGKHGEQAAPGVTRFEKSLRRTAVALGAVGAGYAAWNAAKGAIEATHQLAEGTSTLTRETGMSASASAHWIAVGKALGIQGNSIGTAFAKLSTAAKQETTAGEHSAAGHGRQSAALKQLEERQHLALVIAEAHAEHEKNAGKASEKISALRLRQSQQLAQAQAKEALTGSEAASAFEELHISGQFVKENQADVGPIMEKVVERLDVMGSHVNKGAVLTKLFGRSWQDLSPLLLEGRDHLDKLLSKAKEFGVELSGDPTKAVEELTEKKREMSLAVQALQLRFTEIAAQPLTEVMGGFIDLAKAIHTGDWSAANRDFEKLTETLVNVAEKAVPKMAEAFAHAAPKLLEGLWHGFQHASLGGEAVIAGALLLKFGLVGKAADAAFGAAGKGLAAKFGAGFAAGEGVEVATAGTIFTSGLKRPSMLSKFAGVGKILGAVLFAALAAEAVKEAKNLPEAIGHAIMPLQPGFGGDESTKVRKDLSKLPKHGPGSLDHPIILTPAQEAVGINPAHPYGGVGHPRGHLAPRFPKGALGAAVMRGGAIEVGERGPEVAQMPTGALVQPLGKGSLADERPIKIDVDGKELMRVVRSEVREAQAAGAGSG